MAAPRAARGVPAVTVLAALIVSWPSYARLTRGLVLGLRSSNYVVSGQLLGFSPLRSLARDIAPNIVGPVLVLASLDIGTAILLLSGLSFLAIVFTALPVLLVTDCR